uniref:retinitis pigmentosa 1-like 1 protein n=1 Tax=Doryrhamphus excisus TaxID=161450 RepID=UPI0025ADD479|nr:retinitis pigmentosa 1-like 1 protein [Doryrhamphus excisus]XP_057908231.1 retinitis pigmentosa 1-like 1 protein [Doryrhamphus excisus]
MQSVQEDMWDPQAPSKHASTLPPRPPSHSRLAHVTKAPPAKRITFYKSGDSQFGGVRMAIHKRSFKCFDALLDDLSQKVPLPFGVRTVTTPRGTHIIKHLEDLQDGGCYLCSDRRQAKPVNMELASKRQSIWHHHSRIPQQPEKLSASSSGHAPHRHRRILLIKNTEPGMRRSLALNRRSTRSMRAFLEEVSEMMQFHVHKVYNAEGRKVDNIQGLMSCSGVLVCVGKEALSPMVLKFLRKSSEEKLPGLGSRSPGLGPRTPGNGTRYPGIQDIRPDPHGAQSRSSDCSEGQESKKSVNFGLETKKSIIHPRSDSSARSTRVSLSSEKSFSNSVRAHSQQRPAIMNDDIEKRVLVNKDGTLSVEMRVRFRLRNDETLQWSTQIRKSPSLTSECCQPSQVQRSYLENGQSESYSDSASFDPDCMDYSSQSRSHTSEGNHCACCYQRQGQQYNLWDPVQGRKQPPAPPPHMTSHTTIRHTHSSSSSSSCNSRRMVCRREKLSNCRRGSASEQGQLVQEQTCVMEQVESRVDIEQDGDTHVEVCKVSRCSSRSEVVTLDGNMRPPSQRSVEEELMEEEVGPPLSRVSSSSRVLQSLKEDQDDDDDELPPSASQCSHRSKLSATVSNKLENKESRGSGAVTAAASCLCGATTPHTPTGAVGMAQAPRSNSNISRASCRSTKVMNHEDEIEELVKALSDTPVQSCVCPNCGGYKLAAHSNSESRASKSLQQACSKSTSPLASQSNANEREHDVLSTQSSKTNLKSHGSAPESRASSVMSTMSNAEPTEQKQERATSIISHKSNTSQKSSPMNKKERRSSAMSSQRSDCSGTTESPNITATEETEGGDSDDIVAKSCLSPKSVSSVRINSPVVEETNRNDTPHSCRSAKSTASIKSGMAERPNSVFSTKSSKSNISRKSKSSHGQCARDEPMVVDPTEEEEEPDMCPENPEVEDINEEQAEERATSALSAKSTTSRQTNRNSNCTAASPDLKEDDISSIEANGKPKEDQERVSSAMSVKSKTSVRSNASQKSMSSNNLKPTSPIPNVITINSPEEVDEVSEETGEGEEVEEKQSKASEHLHDETLSPRRIRSPRSHPYKAKAASPSSNDARGQSALSVHSATSTKSGKFKCHCGTASTCEEGKDKDVGEENEAEKQEDNWELNGDPGGTEPPLSPNSSGSVSLGLALPDDQEIADSDSGKSCVSFHTGTHSKGRLRTATPNVHKSPESNINGSTHEVHIPTIEVPGVDGHDDCRSTSQASRASVKNLDDSRPSSSSGNAKNSKVAQQSDGALTNADCSRTPTNAEDIPDNEGASSHSSGPCRLGTNLAVDAKENALKQSRAEDVVKANDIGSVSSVKTSSSPKKEVSSQSSRHCPMHNSRPCSKAETCGKSAMSAADLPDHQKSEASKASSTSRKEKTKRHQMKESQKTPDKEYEVTPACLPNASPSEVVSDWLRSIPSDNNMLVLDDLAEFEPDKEVVAEAEEVTESKEESPKGEEVDTEDKVEDEEKEEEGVTEEDKTNEDLAPCAMETSYRPDTVWMNGKSLPKNWRSSTAVMKVLLSSSLGRCRSLPEVSPVYGRRLSTSARGLLDCLAQLQLIEPTGNQGCNQIDSQNRKYEDIMTILQSLWLTDPRDIDTKDIGTEQVTPPRSSSGVGMSSGSGGSGKDHENQGGDETLPKESSHEEEEAAGEEEPEPETKDAMAELVLEEEPLHSEDQSNVLPALDSLKAENPSSSDKSSANNTFNSSSGTPPTVLHAPLSKGPSHEPDPVWVLHLLKKLEKQFMNHYIDAMAEFKVRWDLDDSLILDTMISELKNEVSSRIQRSIEREMRKIRGRAGRGEKSPRPPKGVNLSRESTMTEKRRRMLKVMKNHSVKTADSFTDGDLTVEFSDQRSDDDYCPCDACVRKKMAARPVKMHPAAAEAPVMMEFDLLKILQLKKTPAPIPPIAPQRSNSAAIEEDGRSLEVVQEEEEDNDSNEDSTDPEEDAGEDVKYDGDQKKSGEKNESEISGEGKCCQCSRGETPERQEAEETTDNMAGEVDKNGDDAEDEGETADDVGETEICLKEEHDSENRAAEEETTERGGDGEDAGEGDAITNQDNEDTRLLGEEEEEEGKSSASAGAEDEEEDGTEEAQDEGDSSQQERVSPKDHSSTGAACMTEGEEADAEDSDADGKRPSDTDADESGANGGKEEDAALLHQFTRTSVESQPGSLED